MNIALIVPVLNRFDLFAQLIKSVDVPVFPIVIDNWNENLGVAAAWNLGMSIAMKEGYRYALIANDDSYYMPRTIEKIYMAMRDTEAVLVSPNPNNQHAPGGLIEGADFFNFIIDVPQLLDSCGTFDENFQPAYFEDNDMHYRIRLSGARSYIHTEAIAHHYGSQTQYADRNNPVCPPHQFENNRRYYTEKWGGQPGQEVCMTPYGSPNHTIKDWDRR
jgi:GT2 family glycosyltransferase